MDLVTAWCARAVDGAAGELRLFVRDGEIAVEERFAKPRTLYAARAPTTSSGRPPVAAPEIARLAGLGYSAQEIVAEGKRRKAAGAGGWGHAQVQRVLSAPRDGPMAPQGEGPELWTGPRSELRPRALPGGDDGDDDVEAPDYMKPAARPRLEGTEELAALMAQPPGPIPSLRARPEHWRPDLLDGRGGGKAAARAGDGA